MDEYGGLQYKFLETVQTIVPFWWTRVFAGSLYVVGVLMLAVNAVMTWLSRPATYEVPVYSAPRLTRGYRDPPVPKSVLEGTPVLEFAASVDKVAQMNWHRQWEHFPVRFTVLTTVAVLIASAFEIIPMFLIRSNIPTISTVKPYTPLELAGRDIYVAEGCYNCHSQMIRPMVAEKLRYGDFSKAGESIYDHPFQWGSRRIGPDLAREGGLQSSFWHWRHFENPTNLSEGSVMPSYRHLLEERLNFNAITDRVRAATFLGAVYPFPLEETPDVARLQAEKIAAEIIAQGGSVDFNGQLIKDSTAVALIAYLQRLGTDLYRTEEPATAPGAATAAATDVAASSPVPVSGAQ
jgi:cytochrome c oxidase cbb3-type subunit I/II